MENPKESTHTKAKKANKQMFQATRSTHKNQLCFYTPAVNNPKKKLRKQSHLGKLSEHRRTDWASEESQGPLKWGHLVINGPWWRSMHQ